MFTTRAANQTREKPSADALENIAGVIFPLIEKLFAELQRFDDARAELDAGIRALPKPAQRWLGLNFADGVAQWYPAALLNEFARMLPVTGAPKKPDFAATSDVLERMQRALATASGGGKNRRMYRAVGTVNGVSGGLTIEHGETVALLDNAETQKLVQSGALLELADTMTEGS